MKNKRILIIGLGISGRSAARFLLQQGASVFGVDGNAKLLQDNEELIQLRQMGLQTAHDSIALELKKFNLIVVSPGIPHKHPLYAAAKASGIEIVGEVELACRCMPFKQFLGITGTNGKTTVTLLVAHILNQSGKRARALGNVGTAMTSPEAQGAGHIDEIIVAELSSYQLETMHSKIIDAAVILNITPDHLDRYGSMDEYAKAKLHIAACLKLNGVLYLEQLTHKKYGHLLLEKCDIRTYGYAHPAHFHTDLKVIQCDKQPPQKVPEPLKGKPSHDLENLMAAYALCLHAGVTPKQFFEGYKTFKKPSHRIEFVAKLNNISYYDDSKGTNLDAVIRAVEAVHGPTILIAGGVDKGAPYTPWITAFDGKVKLICAIGQAATKIENDLNQSIPVKLFSSLKGAVEYAAAQAQPGDNIMLSPGCSSLDMYRDYAHRGQEFQKIVKSLKTD